MFLFLRYFFLCLTLVFSVPVKSQSGEAIPYCIDPDWMPYEALRNGAHIGISADFLALITELTDLQFKFVKTESWQQSLDFVKQGQCEMVTLVNPTPSNTKYLAFSYPYLEAPNVLIAKKGTPMIQGYSGIGDRVVGIVEGYRHAEFLARYYPEVQVEYVKSEKEGLQEVARGNLDVMVGALLSVNVNLNALGMQTLNVVGYAEPFDSLRLGLSKEHSHNLARLNAALDAIPESRKVEIYKRWNTTFVQDESSLTAIVTTVAIGGGLLFLLIWFRKVKLHWQALIETKTSEVERLQSTLLEKNRTLEFLSNHDPVTGLYNRNHMMHKAQEEIARFQRFHAAVSLIAIEVMRASNDSSKTNSEDFEAILRCVADVCLATVREVDVAVRWSGEQFVILCPQTTVTEARALSERLMDGFKSEGAEKESRLHVALGIAALHGNETFTDWYDRAAKALYQSKRNGFNVVCVAD